MDGHFGCFNQVPKLYSSLEVRLVIISLAIVYVLTLTVLVMAIDALGHFETE